MADIKEEEDTGVGSMATSCLGNTSAHGLPRLVADGHVARRVLWLLIFLGCFSGFSIQTYRTFRDYLQYPVAVTTTVKPTKSLTFPAVTVCNMNMLKSSLLEGTKFEKLRELDEQFKTLSDDDILKGLIGSSGGIYGSTTTDLYGATDSTTTDLYGATDSTTTGGVTGGSTTDVTGSTATGGTTETTTGVTAGTTTGGTTNGAGGTSTTESLTTTTDPLGIGRKKRDLSENGEQPLLSREKRDYDDYYGGDYNGGGDYGDPGNSDSGGGGTDYESDVKFEYQDYGFGKIKDSNAYDQFLNAARTADLSDLSGVLRPTKKELESYGHKAQEFILQCSFDKTSCNYTDFKVAQNAFYGNCYTFNHGHDGVNVINTTQYGSRYGLRLTLNIQSDEYIGLFSPTVGARVTIHPHDHTPFPQDEGVDVMPGSETSIGIKVQEIQRQEEPYPSNCTKGNYKGLHEFEISKDIGTFKYSFLACRLTCFQNQLFKRCKCYDKVVDNSTVSRCDILNSTQERCKQKTRNKFDNFKLGCDCPLPCLDRSYTQTVSAGVWPSGPYKNLLKRNIASDIVGNASDNLLRVHVYFADRNILEIVEVPSFSDEQLAANIGGNLGLFIGISICTAMELVELILDGITLFCRRRCCKNKTDPTKS